MYVFLLLLIFLQHHKIATWIVSFIQTKLYTHGHMAPFSQSIHIASFTKLQLIMSLHVCCFHALIFFQILLHIFGKFLQPTLLKAFKNAVKMILLSNS